MFDLKKFLEDSATNIGRALGVAPQPASVRQQTQPTPQPASTRQQFRTPVNQSAVKVNNTPIDIGSFANDVFKNVNTAGSNIGNFANDVNKNLLAPVASGIQQSVANVADTALMGGAALSDAGDKLNPFINDQRRSQLQQQNYNNTEAARNFLKNNQTVTGAPLNAKSDYAPTGDFGRDAANVLGRAAQTGLDATMFVNPTQLAAGQGFKAGAGNILRNAGKEAALFGGGQGIATGAQTYGDTGDLGKSLAEGARSGLLAGATQGGLNVAGAAVRPTINAIGNVTERATNYGLARPTQLTNPELAAASRMRQANQGLINPQSITPDEAMLVRSAEQRLGAQPGTPQGQEAVAQALDKNRAFEVERGRRQQKVNNFASRLIPGSSIKNTANDVASGQDGGRVYQEIPDSEVVPFEAPQGKQTRFASKTAPQSGNLSAEVAQRVRENAPNYDPATNQGSLRSSLDYLQTKGIDGSADDIITRLDANTIDRQTAADALAAATALDVRGSQADLERASLIYDKLSTQFTKAGQTAQAASIINRRTAQGLLYDAQRQLKNAGVTVTPETRNKVRELAAGIDNIDRSLTGEERETAKQRVIAELQQTVNKEIPTDLTDKLVGTWKAGLLTGIRTTTGGVLSNALFRGLREVSRPGAALADALVSTVTGKRSVALTSKGAWNGTKEGLTKGLDALKTGIDERSFTADGKYIDREINFNNPALRTYVNGVFRVMGAADRPFYYSQFRNSLAEAAVVEAKNLGLKGKEFDNYVLSGIKSPTVDATQYATRLAEQAVLANDTFLSNAANKLRAAAENMDNPAARAASKAVLGVLAPFTKVPSAFLTRVIDFTPIGAVKEAAEQAAKGKLNQAKLVQALSEATTGSAIIYLGAEIANADLLSGNYPNDRQEQARWKAERITPNSIRLTDPTDGKEKWFSLNYAGPLGALMNIGKAITDSAKETGDPASAASAGLSQLASGTLEQSFLSGVSGALDAVQDPKRYAENFVRSQSGSVVPTILNDVGNATDETQRQANTPLEAVQARIPGARTGLNEKTDSFGNVLSQANDSKIGRLVDPLRPSNVRENSLTKELSRLSKGGEAIYPTTDKTIKVGDEIVKLTPEQQKSYNDSIGQRTQEEWNRAILAPTYISDDDAGKRKRLSDIQSSITAEVKRDMLASLDRKDLAGKIKQSSATTKEDKYATNDAEYNTLLKEYETKVKDGKYSTAEKIKAESALNKAKVGSEFSKESRDLYGLSKQQLLTYVENNPNGNNVLNQVIAYGDALKDAGLTTYNKFRNSKTGAVSLASTKKAGGKKGKKIDYASKISSTNSAGNSNSKALRTLLKRSTIKRKQIKGSKA